MRGTVKYDAADYPRHPTFNRIVEIDNKRAVCMAVWVTFEGDSKRVSGIEVWYLGDEGTKLYKQPERIAQFAELFGVTL